MSVQIDKFEVITINTNYRLDPTNSTTQNFNYIINPPNWGGRAEDYYISVIQLDFPLSFYTIREGAGGSERNTFYITEDNLNYYPIILNSGNYTIDTLAGQIKKQLNNNVNLNLTYNCIVAQSTALDEPETGKIQIIYSNDVGTEIVKIKFLNSYRDDGDQINEVMGFSWFASGSNSYQDGESVVYTFDPTNKNLYSNIVCNLSCDDEVYIYSNIINPSSSIIKSSSLLYSISCRGSAPFSNVVYDNSDFLVNSKRLNTSTNIFNFTVVDEWGNTIDMNYGNWFMKIMIWKKGNIYNMIDNFIKYSVSYNKEQDEQFKNFLEQQNKETKGKGYKKLIKNVLLEENI